MALVPLIEYDAASTDVRAVFDDIANETNRLSNGYRIDVDERFRDPVAF